MSALKMSEMSARLYIATQAITGYITYYGANDVSSRSPQIVAQAFKIADAMLAYESQLVESEKTDSDTA